MSTQEAIIKSQDAPFAEALMLRQGNWDLTNDNFEKLLNHLAPEREQAGQLYEDIRHDLVKFFEWRGCVFADTFADAVIDRVIKKLDQDAAIYDLRNYFFGVARKIFLEYLRKSRQEKAAFDQLQRMQVAYGTDEDQEECFEVLDRAMQGLTAEERQLILAYYQGEIRERIEGRKRMAEQLGIPGNALRIRVH